MDSERAPKKRNPESGRRRSDDAEMLLGVEVVPSLQGCWQIVFHLLAT
jgi:hypothetical protein